MSKKNKINKYLIGGSFKKIITKHGHDIRSNQYLKINDEKYVYEIRPLEGIQYFDYLIKNKKFIKNKDNTITFADNNNLIIERKNKKKK